MPDTVSALRGSLWMVLAAVFFAVMGVLVKLAGKGFAPAELVFYRCLLGLGGIGIASFYQGRSLRTPRLGLHLTRGLIGSAGMLLHFTAISRLPLATAVTLNYTAPLFLTLATFFFFGERPRWQLVLSVLLGFGGILLLLHPTFNQSDALPGIIGLAAGCCGGMAFLSTRELGRQGEPAWRVVFYFSLVATVLNGVWMLFEGAHSVVLGDLPVLLGIGISATLAQLAMTRAYRDGHVLLVGSFSYLTVVFTSGLGILLWSEFLSATEWLGIALVVSSGVAAAIVQTTTAGKAGS